MNLYSLKDLYWLLPLLILAGVALWYARRTRRNAIEMLSGENGTCHLKTNASPLRRKVLGVALIGALILSAIAVLRPTGGTTISSFKKPAKNIVIMIDVSKSMAATDAEGLSRMDAAKLLARGLIDLRPTDRIGLLSFAGGSFNECPTTLDRTMLLQRIDSLYPGCLRIKGTDLENAFREAENLLTEEPPPGSALIILSDGDSVIGNHQKIVEELAKAKVPVLSVAFGSPTIPAPVPNSAYQSKAEHDILRAIATTTSGIFLEGKPAQVDLQIDQIASRIDAIEISGDNIAPELFDRPLDLYAYPLTIALILLMLHLFIPLRSKNWHPFATAIAILFFLPNLSKAQDAFPAYEAARQDAIEAEKPLLLIFTGSDWSPLSITFEEEILSHPVYQKWEKRTVVSLLIDLPRTGIDPETRQTNRAHASRFDVGAYPAAIFVEPNEQIEIGRLTHDDGGPAAWIKRADAILAGDLSQSDVAASVDALPEEVRTRLQDETRSEVERSIDFYNKALEIERSDKDLAIKSKDRFKLLVELYTNASESAPILRPDLSFAALHKVAILHHRRSRSLVPEDIENMAPAEMMRLAEESKGDIIKLLKKARTGYRRSLSFYRQAAPLNPGEESFSVNLAVAYRDLARVTAYIDYSAAYQKAIETTVKALAQETRFRKSLDYEVTTRKPINDTAVRASAEAIRDLVKKGAAIEDKPTILKEEDLSDYRLAEEDIDLAPAPHKDRHLHPSVQHIQDALDHLIDPQEMQPQPQPGEGEPEDGDPQEGDEGEEEESGPEGDRPDIGDEEDGDQGKGDSDADLRRSEKEDGNLRDRLLEQLRENLEGQRRAEGRGKPRVKDH